MWAPALAVCRAVTGWQSFPGCRSGSVSSAQEARGGRGHRLPQQVSEGDSSSGLATQCPFAAPVLGETGEGDPAEGSPPGRNTQGQSAPPPPQLLEGLSLEGPRAGGPLSGTPRGELGVGRLSGPGRGEGRAGAWPQQGGVGSRAVLHRGPRLRAGVPRAGPVPATISDTVEPSGTAGGSVGLTPGFCYLCTMSLISFTELRSLLKSWVAAGPLPAVAGQI